ncbi:MAG: hypothetical protein PHS97_01865 [Oscillospiraceae bacterium]|nr:hypothetical protein [Oscillospiraceae bacterium]
MINEILIEEMYRDLVNEYGRSLRPSDRAAAKNILNDLLDKGFDYEFIYWALWNLGSRDLISNKGLIFNKSYQEEVKSIASKARDIEEDFNPSIERIAGEFSIIIEYDDYFKYCNEEEKDRIAYYDDRFYNHDDFNLTDEELEEVNSLYIKYYLKRSIAITKEEMRKERDSIIAQLKSAKIYVDYKTIPYHDYQ